ncbi:MAG TPA: enolase C-terminal domain-like protein [Aggregatilineales bacterium]|nr:enolase C-terminal domain-like protein [Aggregatilineales bacterium]
MLPSDIRVVDAQAHFSHEYPRAALKFGGRVAGKVTLAHVRVRVENRRGQVADGWGAILLSHYWAFPAETVDHDTKDALMRRVTAAYCERLKDFTAFAHPIDIFMALQPELHAINLRICREMASAEAMPYLGALVCASPLDAALHDAFGLVNGVSSYAALSADWISHDLSAYLGQGFTGRYLSEFLRPEFAPSLPVWHVVGGLDWLRASDVPPDAPETGLPRSLDAWIRQDGVYCFKAKPSGRDLGADREMIRTIYDVAREQLAHDRVFISLDANEQCASPAYMIELLHRLRAESPALYHAIRYIEQPVARDLAAERHDMHPLAALKPVIVDESLSGLDELDLALELGWSGIALKTCKCHTLNLLLLARAEVENIPYTVQDLTNPGIALLHSVGLAARTRPLLGIETNARQYYPDISIPEAEVHPRITGVREGELLTESLQGPGLGYQLHAIHRDLFQVDTSTGTGGH